MEYVGICIEKTVIKKFTFLCFLAVFLPEDTFNFIFRNFDERVRQNCKACSENQFKCIANISVVDWIQNKDNFFQLSEWRSKNTNFFFSAFDWVRSIACKVKLAFKCINLLSDFLYFSEIKGLSCLRLLGHFFSLKNWLWSVWWQFIKLC